MALSLGVLERVENDRAYARPLLQATFARHRGLPPAQRALVTRLVRGTLQWQLQLDHHLAALLPRGLERTDPRVRWILRLGAHDVLHGAEGQPLSIAVDRAVQLARDSGRAPLAGLVNAVLRRLAEAHLAGTLPLPDPQRDPAGYLAVVASLPRWLARRWLDELGTDEALACGLSLDEPPPLTVRVQPPASPAAWQTLLAERGVESRPASRAPDGLVLGSGRLFVEPDWLEQGELFVQDEASILVGHLVDPQPGWVVLDACASPGGKSAHLAGLLGGRGEVHARDVGDSRLRLLREAARRAHFAVEPGDLLAPPVSSDLGRFDAVLLDAPCSNLGTLRRHPEAKARIEEEVVAQAAAQQQSLIAAAAALVRPGGLLVYSVCSVAPEEGWGVVDRFLAGSPGAGFDVEPPTRPELFAGLLDDRQALRSWPHRHGMDGFFAVRLRRQPSAGADVEPRESR